MRVMPGFSSLICWCIRAVPRIDALSQSGRSGAEATQEGGSSPPATSFPGLLLRRCDAW